MIVLEERIEALKKEGKKAGIDAFLVTSEKNMKYFAGFSTSAVERFAGIIVPVETGFPVVIVPRLEETKAKKSPLKEIRSYSDSENPKFVLNKTLKELRLENARLGVEGTLPFKFYQMLVAASSKMTAEDASKVFSQLRCVKSRQEQEMIEKAASIVAEGIKAGIEFAKPGVTEMAISGQIEGAIKENGGESVPFCLVLSGPNSALPHGETSNRKVSENDVVLMDVGAVYKGYNGDLTRTIFVGEATKKQREVYDCVAKAQEAAISRVKPSVMAEEIDAAARRVIEKAGYGEYFTHRTGHGLGLDVHEEPYIVQGNKTMLRSGMVFTVEPGIYLDKFGVRIEDNMVVSNTKGKMLSHLSKELVVI